MSQRRKAWSKWRKLVSQQGKSGQSVAAFCRQRGLCAPHFFAWKKRLNQASAQKFVEVRVTAAAVEASRAKDTAIEILLPQDRRLRVRPGFDAQHLQEVLAVLEKRS
jgi:hypothetical protein